MLREKYDTPQEARTLPANCILRGDAMKTCRPENRKRQRQKKKRRNKLIRNTGIRRRR